MILGCIMYPITNYLQALIPWVIGLMLFLTYLKISPKDLQLRATHFICLIVQLLVACGLYFIVSLFSLSSAEALCLCIFTPAAVAGPTIVQLLSGDSKFTASYTLLTHLGAIIYIPLLFPLIQVSNAEIDFLPLALKIFKTIFPIIVLPILSSWIVRYFSPQLKEKITSYKKLSYICWIFSVWLLMGKTTVYVMNSQALSLGTFALMSLVALVACLSQFLLGLKSARVVDQEKHSIAHALGQKNTSLAIWLSTLYLSPASTLSAVAYIVWQNIYITYRLAQSNEKSQSSSQSNKSVSDSNSSEN